MKKSEVVEQIKATIQSYKVKLNNNPTPEQVIVYRSKLETWAVALEAVRTIDIADSNNVY